MEPDRIEDTEFAERHRTTRARALDTPRGRLIDAMVECVGARGYSATTLTDIVGSAHVSRSTFYEHFVNKEHCFVEAVHTGVAMIRTRISDELAELPADADPRARIAAMITTFCAVVAAEPDFSRLILVESLLLGEATAELRDDATDTFALMYRKIHEQARRIDPALGRVPDDVIALVPDAIGERTRRVVLNNGASRVPELAPAFIEFTNTVLGLATAPVRA
ncbi:putative transcriptional regulator, TetR family [Nocardia nova SH22a]|uniref:Putative transcriptional regulator, TetR family n=1 Tax=Nocardia nova SH22a TaxID=1415166 RepID=W5TR85_9NOCA|nr:TetR/AcrR family transcriptional regulator [Nocardia nova]AHH21433.1 putative transcriptional regulator, TetR family [Nocardia nova SH22a]